MPVSLAIAAHRGASAPMNAAKSCGEPIFASALKRARPAWASLDLRISLTAPLSFSTIACRRSGRGQQSRPERGHELGISALGRGRYVRQQRRALIRRHRQRAQPPAFDVRQKDGSGLEDHLDLAGYEIRDRLARAAIGNVDDVDVGRELQHLSEHVRLRSIAGGSERDLARIALGVGDELRQRIRRHRRDAPPASAVRR